MTSEERARVIAGVQAVCDNPEAALELATEILSDPKRFAVHLQILAIHEVQLRRLEDSVQALAAGIERMTATMLEILGEQGGVPK